jgi:hypothetical protein
VNSRRAQLVFLLASRSARLLRRSPKAGICYRINRALDQARNHFQGCLPEPAGGGATSSASGAPRKPGWLSGCSAVPGSTLGRTGPGSATG